MEIHCLNAAPPKAYDWAEDDIAEFSEYELEEISSINPEVAFYWYTTGCYEGSGQLLFLKDGEWHLHDCGHCSCYGPTDEIDTAWPLSKTLDGIREKCSDERWDDVAPLVILAKSKGYK